MSVFEKSIKFENQETISKRNLGYRKIEPNKEIVLFEKHSYDDREKQEFNKSGDFRNEKCEKGLVVTITFFDKKAGGYKNEKENCISNRDFCINIVVFTVYRLHRRF